MCVFENVAISAGKRASGQLIASVSIIQPNRVPFLVSSHFVIVVIMLSACLLLPLSTKHRLCFTDCTGTENMRATVTILQVMLHYDGKTSLIGRFHVHGLDFDRFFQIDFCFPLHLCSTSSILSKLMDSSRIHLTLQQQP